MPGLPDVHPRWSGACARRVDQRFAAERMRKPAFCASAGPAAPAGTDGAGSSAAADPAGGLLPDAVARDIQALILQTEEVAATGRACQTFVREMILQ